ncbi:c-type cytochrome [Steroidobacter sp.]|uniref:c-type cytochrome n=1 Tax=Steroidobacter sp. TaxID=1978227 RepID=UPI0032C22D85
MTTHRLVAALGVSLLGVIVWAVSVVAAEPAKTPCDISRGERVFAKCAICHSRAQDVPSPAGPNLAGVIGRKAGTAANFKYSSAMKKFARSWSADELDRFLQQPASVVPGTTMAFAGLSNADDRRALICILATPSP